MVENLRIAVLSHSVQEGAEFGDAGCNYLQTRLQERVIAVMGGLDGAEHGQYQWAAFSLNGDRDQIKPFLIPRASRRLQ